jgi:hypothetical protein
LRHISGTGQRAYQVPQGFPIPLPISIIICTPFRLLSEEMYLFRINNMVSYFRKRDKLYILKLKTFGDKTQAQLRGEDKLPDSPPLKRIKEPNTEVNLTQPQLGEDKLPGSPPLKRMKEPNTEVNSTR